MTSSQLIKILQSDWSPSRACSNYIGCTSSSIFIHLKLSRSLKVFIVEHASSTGLAVMEEGRSNRLPV